MERVFNIKVWLLPMLLMLQSTAIAQDPSFSQFYSNPLYLNPAFSGSLNVARINLHYRNQWPDFGNAYATYSLSADMPVPKLGGGVGLLLVKDAQAGGALETLQLQGAWTVVVKIDNSLTLHGALQAGFGTNSLSIHKLLFADNFDPATGFTGISKELENFDLNRFSYADFSMGMMLSSRYIYGGFAIHHINEPIYSFFDGDDLYRLARRYSAHFGAKFPVYRYGQLRKIFDLSPHFAIRSQYGFVNWGYGLLLYYKGVEAGIIMNRSNTFRYNSAGLILGYSLKQLRIAYSHEFVVSGLPVSNGGVSEVTLSYLFRTPNKVGYLPFYDFYDE